MSEYPWQRPLGATVKPDGIEMRVWAPRVERVAIRLGRDEHALEPTGYGIWEGVVKAQPGDDYRVLLDGRRHADPCSRFQPRGLRGPSRVVDPGAFEWTDDGWRGIAPRELVIYELHVGTFTDEGTFDAVRPHLHGLRELGVTAIELMPVAAFPGERGWGYDGVYAFAPHEPYGGPEGLRRLVDAAHAEGMAVILDVVYNHLGASGVRSIEAFGPYFTDRHKTDWGKAMNYDGPDCDPVREWAIQSACMWAAEYRIDGLRLDAVHAIVDTSPRHVVAELAERIREVREHTIVIAETNRNDPVTIRPAAAGGWGLDGQWADDFHHSLRVLLTGEQQGYYADFGRVGDLAAAFRRPFVYDGRYSGVRRRRVGAPAGDRPPEQFVVCSQNHDQVGNRAFGDRMPPEARPLAALCTLLSPFVPLLFMGEEYGEDRPFQFFTNHISKRIAEATREGRRREFAEFAEFAGEIPDPEDPATFERSKLSRRSDPRIAGLYRDLLRLRSRIGAAEAEPAFNDEARWLRVRRGDHELVCNFRREAQSIPVELDEVVLATHGVEVAEGEAMLPALAGAVLR